MSGECAKGVLDPCCGSRMFYFDKRSPSVLYCDNRRLTEELCDGRLLVVDPDLRVDVCDMPFDDRTFPLVVFDPPHLTAGQGWQVKKYGKLPGDWRAWMTRAFSECWRVLADNGTLVFKWYEYRIALAEVLECAPCQPLFGNRRPGGSKTHWLVFFKAGDAGESRERTSSFCGGEAHITVSSDGYGVERLDEACWRTLMDEHGTEAEAVAAWNRRAGHTCHDVSKALAIDTETEDGLEGEELRGALEDIIGFCEQWLHDLDESEES